MSFKFPQIHIALPPAIQQAEQIFRQLGLGQEVEAQAIAQAADVLAKSGLHAWQLRDLSEAFSQAAQTVAAQESATPATGAKS